MALGHCEDCGSLCICSCSGGNKRKLSTAIAMVGNPPIVMLVSPSPPKLD